VAALSDDHFVAVWEDYRAGNFVANAVYAQEFAPERTGTDGFPPAASVSIAPLSADKAEGNGGSTAFTFTLTRTGNTAAGITTTWAVQATGTNPAAASDFPSTSTLPVGSYVWLAGQLTQTITVNVAGDTGFETDETFQVAITSAGAGLTASGSPALATIRNDDSFPAATLVIAATSAAKAEGNSGSTAFTFLVTRAGETSVSHSATWTVSGSAVTAADFVGGTFPTGTVSFAVGEISKVITVNVAGDMNGEMDEAFQVALSAPSQGATISSTASRAFGTIQNDDIGTPTPGQDTLYGTAAADVIDALGGDDILNGNGGNDTLTGGAGVDQIDGGEGNDTLIFDAADLTGTGFVRGGAGTDTARIDGARPSAMNAAYMQANGIEKVESKPNATTTILETLSGTGLIKETTLTTAGGVFDFYSIENPDGSAVYYDVDQGNTSTLAVSFLSYAAGGVFDYGIYTYDDGVNVIYDVDQANTSAVSAQSSVFTPAWVLDYSTTIYDNGTALFLLNDKNNNQAWTNIGVSYTATGAVAFSYVLYDNGTVAYF
jgi:hypothetical protein